MVRTCPICGKPGGLGEIDRIAKAAYFAYVWRYGTFQQIWDAIPDRGCM